MIRIVNKIDAFPGTTSGTITIPATTSGNVIIIIALGFKQAVKWTAPNFISTSDGNFTEVPYYSLQGGSLWDWGSVAGSGTSADILYQVTSGGVTSVNFNANLAVDEILIREVSGLVTPVAVDDFKMVGSGTNITVVGTALSGTGTNDLCIENFSTAVTFLSGMPTTASPWVTDSYQSSYFFQKGVSGSQVAPTPVDNTGASVLDTYTCVSVALKGVGLAPTTPTDANGNPVTLKYAFGDNGNTLVRFVDTNNNIHTIGPLYTNDYQGTHFLYSQNPPGAAFSGPWGVSMLGDHLVYVADQGSGILWQINIITGTTVRVAGGGTGSGFPNEIATNWHFAFQLYTVKGGLDGNIYIGSPGLQTIVCVNMQNAPITVCGVTIPVGFAAEVAGFSTGQGFKSDYSVAVDALGNVYAGEEGNNTGSGNDIWKTNTTGAATKIAGNGTAANTGDGGPASAASLDSPLGLSIDNNNILYIICAGINGNHNGAIRAINLSNITQTICGQTIAPGNIATLATGTTGFNDLWALAPDNQGNVYVCDVDHSGVSAKAWLHKIDTLGVYSIVAGSPSGTPGYSGDGGPATSALIGVTFGVGIPTAPPTPPPPNFPAPPGGDRFKLTPAPTSGPVQNIPLDNAPNQTWNISVNVNGNPIPLKLVLRYNEIAAYWVATIFDGQGNLLLDSIPFITGAGISQNLLAQFPYLEIGSATIFNASQQA